jgi:TonB-dependent receptor
LCLAEEQVSSTQTEEKVNETSSSVAATAKDATSDGTQSLEEALDKKPGINFSTVQIGGQSSGISLSSIRADSVESLEALKLATPDLDADIIGGTLSLRFKPAYTQREPTRQLRVYITRYALADKAGGSFYLTEGQAFGSDNRWGYLLNARAYESFIAEENLNRDWQTRSNSDWPNTWRFQDVQIEKESYRTRSVSANLLFDYELSKKLRLYARGVAADTNRTEVNRHMEYEWDDGKFIALDDESAVVEGMALFKGIEDRKYERETRELTVGAHYKGEDWHWEIQMKYDSSHARYPRRLDSFFKAENIDASYQNAQGIYPVFTLLNGSESRANDTSQFQFNEVREITSSDLFVDKIASFDLERHLPTTSGLLKLKSGVKFLKRDLDSSDDRQVYDESTEPLTIAQFPSDWESGPIHEGNYNLNGFHDHGEFREYFFSNPDTFILNETRTRSQTDPAIYTVNETISSFFLMSDYNWNQWRLIAGVRGERTEDEFTGKEVSFDENGDYERTIDTEGGRTYTNFFPGLHAVFQANERLTLYSSVSQALERPRYYYLAPFRRINQRSQYIREGNPDLKATEFTSFLAAADWAYAKSGFISLELLRRDNENIVVESQSVIMEGQFKDFDLFTWENAAKGTLNQVELVWNQDLDPILYDLEGFSLEMRYRHNDTESDVRGPESDPLPIAGIPDKDMRTSLIYQNQNWLLRLRADHQSERLWRVGATLDDDTYYFDSTSYDFTVEYRTSNGWVGNLAFYNFNDDPRHNYFGTQDRPADLVSRGRYWRSSVRYTF